MDADFGGWVTAKGPDELDALLRRCLHPEVLDASLALGIHLFRIPELMVQNVDDAPDRVASHGAMHRQQATALAQRIKNGETTLCEEYGVRGAVAHLASIVGAELEVVSERDREALLEGKPREGVVYAFDYSDTVDLAYIHREPRWAYIVEAKGRKKSNRKPPSKGRYVLEADDAGLDGSLDELREIYRKHDVLDLEIDFRRSGCRWKLRNARFDVHKNDGGKRVVQCDPVYWYETIHRMAFSPEGEGSEVRSKVGEVLMDLHDDRRVITLATVSGWHDGRTRIYHVGDVQ